MIEPKEDISESIFNLGKKLSLIFILIAFISYLLLLSPFFLPNVFNYSKLGTLGDAVGGFLNPLIAISAALLTFLAFYIQYQANQQVEKQFKHQQIADSNNFEYTKLKDRIYLVMNEIENFEISFHQGKLISKLNEIPKSGGKKYNFKGIQGINLFLIEYFGDRSEKIKNKNLEYTTDDSFHSIAMNINNLITLFFNIHTSVHESKLDSDFSSELKELLDYTYYSKLDFVVDHFSKNIPSGKLNEQIIVLKSYYRRRK